MAWKIEISEEAERVLMKMDRNEQRRFDKFFMRLAERENPRSWCLLELQSWGLQGYL